MDILFLLIPLSVVLVFVIGVVFWLALKGGQFDDLESPGLDIVLDDDSSKSVSPESARSGESSNERGHPE
ncbi:MAG: cbb3-type cytochrome oxidase assembly protein CcoS [Burkholderiales bacterium]|nr:cbb3-type cytochrome oxidase assembly protein CcoS [Burkholderiales bacterium]MCJ7839001.1 cbb3-type cytochrome oxidase assembly protein CcoS [Burkholderiales bacterium]